VGNRLKGGIITKRSQRLLRNFTRAGKGGRKKSVLDTGGASSRLSLKPSAFVTGRIGQDYSQAWGPEAIGRGECDFTIEVIRDSGDPEEKSWGW